MEERLQKYMASCGIASRRKCEDLIMEGKVKVNNIIVKELGVKVDPSKDTVKYLDKIINKEENKVYYLLNKPTGYITSVKDEKSRKTVLDLVRVKERIYPIGRLDYDSSGLIILTNDGEIYNKLIHPRVKINKKYIVKVKGSFTEDEKKMFTCGVDIGGYVTAQASIKQLYFNNLNNISTVEIEIHEGKNRQIRKMCTALNHDVISLKRVSIGKIELGNLKIGEFRSLTKDEISYINSL